MNNLYLVSVLEYNGDLNTEISKPVLIGTSKRHAITLTIDKMLTDENLLFEDIATAKKDLNESGNTKNFPVYYTLEEVKPNTFFN